MIAAFLSLFLATSAMADSFNIGCFTGLNDTDSGATISDCEAQSALNVEANLTGTALMKRKGYNREAALTVATAPVTGSFYFLADSGDNIVVACHDRYCSKSTNGGAFVNFLSTASASVTRWSFVQVDGDLFGANDARNPVFKYTGSGLTHPAAIPAGSILELTQDRLVVADTAANPNRINYSASGDYTNFTGGTGSTAAWTDDLGSPGDRVTGLKYDAGYLYIFKTQSINVCEIGNQYTTKCTVLTTAIGTQDPSSIVSAPDGIFFRGNDKHYWSISGGRITKLSTKIGTLVASQPQGSTRNNTQTTQADWEAGSQNPSGLFDTKTIPGSIFPSSITWVDTSSSNFAAGISKANIDYASSGHELKLSSNTFQDSFYGPSVTTFNPWVISGNLEIQNNYLRGLTIGDLSNKIELASSISTGSWSFDFQFSNTEAASNWCQQGYYACWSFKFIINSSGDFYAASLLDGGDTSLKKIQIKKSVSSSETVLSNSSDFSMTQGTTYKFDVVRSTDGRMTAMVDGVVKASTTADSGVVGVSSMSLELTRASAGSVFAYVYLNNLYAYHYKSSGTFISQIFDTSFSTPIGGVFGATETVRRSVNDGEISYWVRSSSSPNNDMWSAIQAASDTTRINQAGRYYQYIAQLNTSVSTKTPSIQEISLLAATTGQYRTQCIEPGGNVSTWGILSCAASNAGNGSQVFYATSALTCATLPDTAPDTWQTTLANNAPLTVGTSAALYIGWKSLLGSATDQAQIDACTVYWNEGAAAKPVVGAYDSISDSIYWGTSVGDVTANNRTIKYDLGLKGWFPFDIPSSSLFVRGGDLWFGSSSGAYWNKFRTTDNDNGSAINSYWKTRDFGAGSPFAEKNFKSISIVALNKQHGNITDTWTMDNGATGNYSISLDTDSAKTYIRNNYAMPPQSPHTFINLNIGNNAADQPWEIDGLRIDFNILPWRPLSQ